jgi:hypothetical protein
MEQISISPDIIERNVLLRAKNSNRQCHFKIWLDCHKLKKFPCLIRYVHVNKMSKKLINQCQLMSYKMMIGYVL